MKRWATAPANQTVSCNRHHHQAPEVYCVPAMRSRRASSKKRAEMPGEGREETYKAHAAECLEIARQTDDRDGKIALLGIARAWLALADQHSKNSQASQGRKSAERR